MNKLFLFLFFLMTSISSYSQTITLNSISPSIGTIGNSVTLSGTNLGNTINVFFGTTASIIQSVSSSTVVATAPNLSSGSYCVYASTGRIKSNCLNFTFGSTFTPTITLTPTITQTFTNTPTGSWTPLSTNTPTATITPTIISGAYVLGPGSSSQNIHTWSGISVKEAPYNATGNGITNDSAAIQAAINSVNAGGGGNVIFPGPANYLANIIGAQGVTLLGIGGSATITSTNGNVPVIDTPNSLITNFGVRNLNIVGFGSGSGDIGIRLRNVKDGVIDFNAFGNLGMQAIQHVAGYAIHINNNFADNSWLNQNPVTYVGVMECDAATDDWIVDNEFTCSDSALSSGGFIAAIALLSPGANHFLSNDVCEISDIGVYSHASISRMTGVRAELNYGHGFIIAADDTLVNCIARDNGQQTNNTYDGFHLVGQGASLSNCQSYDDGAVSQEYGFNDTVQFSATYARNNIVGCVGLNNGTSLYGPGLIQGSAPIVPNDIIEPSSGTTISVENSNIIIPNYSASVTVVNFSGGANGQIVHMEGQTFITLQNGSGINTATGTYEQMQASYWYDFLNEAGTWNQLNLNIPQTIVQNSFSINPLSTGSTNTTLTLVGYSSGAAKAATIFADQNGGINLDPLSQGNLITNASSYTLDPGTGSFNATFVLVGRNAGTSEPTTIIANENGDMQFTAKSGRQVISASPVSVSGAINTTGAVTTLGVNIQDTPSASITFSTPGPVTFFNRGGTWTNY